MFSYFVKVERVSHVIVCLAVEISKQSVEGAACLFLNPESKMQKERDELKKELLSRKESELGDLENSVCYFAKKMRKPALNRTLREWLSSRFIKRSWV